MDYYQILEVSQEASIADIKKAYRKLSKKYHPDVKGGDEEAFKRITEAYQVLSNPDSKQEYDQRYYSNQTNSDNIWAWESNYDNFSSMFDDYFDNYANINYGDLDYYINMHISLKEAYNGFTTYIKNPRNENLIFKLNPKAQHKDIYIFKNNGYQRKRGYNPYRPNNSVISGDLIVTIYIDNDDYFTLKGNNVFTEIEIPWYDLILGGKVNIKSFIDNEKLKFTIPEKTKPNTKFRLKGKGYPIKKSNGNLERGDLYCKVDIKYPNLNNDQKEKLNSIKNKIEGEGKN